MREVEQAIRVAVAVNPLLLRSALHAALAADGRFEAYLCLPAADPVTFAKDSGAQMLVVSEPVQCADVCVIELSPPGRTVSVINEGACQQLPYSGTAELFDRIARRGDEVRRRQKAG